MERREVQVKEATESGIIEYIPFPSSLVGKYQAFTQADLTKLRKAGYEKTFRTVEEGTKEYILELLKVNS